MEIIIIAALTKNHVIGKDNKLLWHISDELKNFKRLTSGNVIIMGRKTFDSLGRRALPNRHSIVISRSHDSQEPVEGVDFCPSLDSALERAKSYGKDIYIIGGASIYGQALKFADKMYLSYVKQEHDGDAFFPKFDENGWKLAREEDNPEFVFREYEKTSR